MNRMLMVQMISIERRIPLRESVFKGKLWKIHYDSKWSTRNRSFDSKIFWNLRELSAKIFWFSSNGQFWYKPLSTLRQTVCQLKQFVEMCWLRLPVGDCRLSTMRRAPQLALNLNKQIVLSRQEKMIKKQNYYLVCFLFKNLISNLLGGTIITILEFKIRLSFLYRSPTWNQLRVRLSRSLGRQIQTRRSTRWQKKFKQKNQFEPL